MYFRYKLLLYAGIILLLIPFLGVPSSWKDTAIFVIAFVVFLVGLAYRHDTILFERHDEEEVFVESAVEEEEERQQEAYIPITDDSEVADAE